MTFGWTMMTFAWKMMTFAWKIMTFAWKMLKVRTVGPSGGCVKLSDPEAGGCTCWSFKQFFKYIWCCWYIPGPEYDALLGAISIVFLSFSTDFDWFLLFSTDFSCVSTDFACFSTDFSCVSTDSFSSILLFCRRDWQFRLARSVKIRGRWEPPAKGEFCV